MAPLKCQRKKIECMQVSFPSEKAMEEDDCKTGVLKRDENYQLFANEELRFGSTLKISSAYIHVPTDSIRQLHYILSGQNKMVENKIDASYWESTIFDCVKTERQFNTLHRGASLCELSRSYSSNSSTQKCSKLLVPQLACLAQSCRPNCYIHGVQQNGESSGLWNIHVVRRIEAGGQLTCDHEVRNSSEIRTTFKRGLYCKKYNCVHCKRQPIQKKIGRQRVFISKTWERISAAKKILHWLQVLKKRKRMRGQ